MEPIPFPPIPENEAQRLEALRRYDILDTEPEKAFDRIARIAAASLQTPMAFVSFVDRDRAWFKSVVGIDIGECPRKGSFCGLTVAVEQPLVVGDAKKDQRFQKNRFVVPDDGVRFYAGAPLRTPEGFMLGTVCVFDTKPRTLKTEELAILEDLAALVVDELELRQSMSGALEARDQRFHDIAISVPGVVFQYENSKDRRSSFSYVSPVIDQVIDKCASGKMIMAGDWNEIVVPEDQAALESSLTDSRRSGEPWSWEGRCLRATNSPGWFRISAIPRSLENGDVLWNGLLLDVNDQKLTEEKLAQTQKMEAIGQLTGGVAHDFNNLLAVIQGNTEHLADETEGGGRALEAIFRACERGASLTRQLLAFSRNQPLEPQNIDPAKLIAGVSEMLHRTLGETISISLDLDDDLWPALVDPTQLENALLNLALNSRDALCQGGHLRIGCKNADRDEFETNDIGNEGTGREFLAISVTDDGTGMSKEVLTRACDPFFTTKDTGKGSGLGLSMVYGFAKQSEGHLNLESEVGHGTKATLYLPRGHEATVEVETERWQESREKKNKRILVVEDDPEVRQLSARTLDTLGYRASSVCDVQAARVELSRNPNIDLVLLDIVLPGGVSGIDLGNELHHEYPNLPIVLMSGYAAPTTLENQDFIKTLPLLRKPFNRATIATTLEDMLGTRQA